MTFGFHIFAGDLVPVDNERCISIVSGEIEQ